MPIASETRGIYSVYFFTWSARFVSRMNYATVHNDVAPNHAKLPQALTSLESVESKPLIESVLAGRQKPVRIS